MTSGTHTINRSHQPCVDVTPTRVRTITPSGSRTRVSGAGCGHSNKERQRLQPLASIGLHTTFTGIHICYIDIPQWVLTRDGSRFSNILFNYRISIRLCDYFLKVYQGLTIKTVRWREGRSDLSLARSGHCRWSLNCIICMRF